MTKQSGSEWLNQTIVQGLVVRHHTLYTNKKKHFEDQVPLMFPFLNYSYTLILSVFLHQLCNFDFATFSKCLWYNQCALNAEFEFRWKETEAPPVFLLSFLASIMLFISKSIQDNSYMEKCLLCLPTKTLRTSLPLPSKAHWSKVHILWVKM